MFPLQILLISKRYSNMLIEFSIENFRSLKENFSFNMIASKSDKFLEANLILGTEAIKMDGDITRNSLGKYTNLLRSAAIYGANASGKSNSLIALSFLKYIITNSIKNMPGDKIVFEPFKLDKKCLSKPCKFDINFISEGIRYNYGASFTDEKVIDEYLYYYPKGSIATIFEREDTTKYNFKVDVSKQNRISEDTLENVFYLASSSQRNYDKTIKAFKWFKEILTANILHSNNPGYTFKLVEDDKDVEQKIARLLHCADFGISNFESKIEDVPYDDLPDDLKTASWFSGKKGEVFKKAEAKLFHKGVDENNNETQVVFELEDESDGTQKMFSLLGPWIDSLNKGLVLVIDELDCELHPLLCELIIKTFNSPEFNRCNAQLIFSAHNTYLMNSELLRRDQIWFTEKNIDTGSTEIYSLLEYKQRHGANFEKSYLNGKYGAIPYIMEGYRDIFGIKDAEKK